MKKFYFLALTLVMVMLAIPSSEMAAQLSSTYTYFTGTGTRSDVTGGTALWTGQQQNRRGEETRTISLGFTFNFDGVDYTEVTVTIGGALAMGGSFNGAGDNNLRGTSNAVVAGFWDYLYITGGAGKCGLPLISYIISGGVGNHVLVVDWDDIELGNFSDGSWGNFQIRLYEATGRIELYYDGMTACATCGNRSGQCSNTSASMGIANGAGEFISLTPSGGSASADSDTPNDYVDLNSNESITEGTMFTFVPCKLLLGGLTGQWQGGTPNMNDGDTLLAGYFVETGTSREFMPFLIAMSDAACTGDFSFVISGPDAGDYYFGTPGNQFYSSTLTNGLRDTARIIFEPTASGLRQATLEIFGPSGYYRQFPLGASAPRINYIPNQAQGGTPRMQDGDTLLKGLEAPRLESVQWRPFQLLNIGSPTPVQVTYTLIDPTGQYTIDQPSVMLASGETAEPVITFNPIGVGIQIATLIVNTEDEVRIFTLCAYSAAPGGQFSINGQIIDTTTGVFSNQFACAGESIIYYPVEVRNIGDDDFTVDDFAVYQTDTIYRQGTPRYPLLRDDFGQPIPSSEYVISDVVPTAPLASTPPMNFPFIVPEGGVRTIYIAFVANRPGKRFARIYLNSNGQNFSSLDLTGMENLGLVSFDLFGRGTGGVLAGGADGRVPASVVFPTTPVGDSSTAWLRLMNTGECSFRLSEGDLRIFAGDVDEFSIISIPATWVRDGVTGDLTLASGASDSIQVQFKPSHIGSRRSTLWMRTNDSTVQVPGLTERGTYYLDLYGEGSMGLYASSTSFGQVMIGQSGNGVATIRNASVAPIIIQSVTIGGADAADFAEDAAKPWMVAPFAIAGGSTMDFSVVFTPSGAVAGAKNAELIFVTDRGDTIRALLGGEAGLRTVTATPGALSFGVISVGKVVRQTVVITNTGSMPLHLVAPVLSGANASDFSLGAMPRLDLAPGQMEFLEVTYMPAAVGASMATLTISSDAPSGDIVIQLNGSAARTKFVDEDPTGTTIGGNGQGLVTPGGQSSVSSLLGEFYPNPARGEYGTIGYELKREGEVSLLMYNNLGEVVQRLDEGMRTIGSHTVRVDMSTLATGSYYYSLTFDGATTTRVINVVK